MCQHSFLAAVDVMEQEQREEALVQWKLLVMQLDKQYHTQLELLVDEQEKSISSAQEALKGNSEIENNVAMDGLSLSTILDKRKRMKVCLLVT